MANADRGITEKILNLLEKGVFTTGFITVVLTVVLAYLWIVGNPIDETLKTSWLVIIGFFFGSGASYQAIKTLAGGEK